MRHNATPLFYELVSTGGTKQIAITPGAAAQSGKFVISGIAPRVQDMRNYLARFWLNLTMTLSTTAVGAATSWDKLCKGLQSAEVISPVLGVPYPHFHTQGATLMHLISYVALGYQYPQGARTQIPASTASSYTVDMFYVIPFAQEGLVDPMESTQWTGFFDGGSVEGIVAPTSVFAGDYSGMTLVAPTQMQCLAECQPSPREFIGVPFQWRRRQIAGGGSSPLLKNVGGETSLNGVSPGAGLAGLYWLSNATGIGLGGSSAVNNILSISLDWRNQKNIQNLDGYFHSIRVAQEKRGSSIGNAPGVVLNDSTAWPKSMDATGQNRPSQDPLQMFLPIVAPGRMQHTSKLQRILGDLQVDFTSTVPFTLAHEFMTMEYLEWTADQANAMATLGLFRGVPDRKSATGRPGTDGNFRYTAIEFVLPPTA